MSYLTFSRSTLGLAKIQNKASELELRTPTRSLVLNSRNGIHSIHCFQEWSDLQKCTFTLCNYDQRKFESSWKEILDYLETIPRYFETGSGYGFICALADKWVELNSDLVES